ncbi:MAG: homocysteine S-methyltransferase family protein [Solirubrobacteraceae bacterium]
MNTEATGQARLLDRLRDGPVICAEGYLFEFERRGYLQAGAFVPEIVLEHPELVAGLHREFVHAGSDVVEAFTYYAHREKMRIIGKEDLIEPLNRDALTIAHTVARETGCLAAGNLCNTNAFYPDAATRDKVRRMFDEQVGWIVDAGMDFVVAETFSWGEEALLALEAIKAAGLTAVVTLSIHRSPNVREGWTPQDACARLEQAGADVVGLNCIRGPATMLPLMASIRDAVRCPVAALPVPYRTTDAEPSFQSLTDPRCDCLPGDRPFPTALEPLSCNRYEIAEFGRKAYAMGINYLGVCCGAAPPMIRSLAEALGRDTPASRYSPDMSRHAFLGSDTQLHAHNQKYASEL